MPRTRSGLLRAILLGVAIHHGATHAQSNVPAAPGCPVDLKPLATQVRLVADAPLRGRLLELLDRPVQTQIKAHGGLLAYEQFLHAIASSIEARRTNSELSADDTKVGLALSDALLRSAHCLQSALDPRQSIARAGAGLPVSAVGLIRRRLGTGTGSLVGRCLVLTNEHVLSAAGATATRLGDPVTFSIGVGDDDGFAQWSRGAIVALGQQGKSRGTDSDWGLIRLERPLGDVYGMLDLEPNNEPPARGAPLWVLGFPADRIALAGGHHRVSSDRHCRYLDERGDTWALDCAASAGQSGGPVLQERDGAARLVAILTAVRNTSLPGGIRLSYVTAASAFRDALVRERAVPCQ